MHHYTNPDPDKASDFTFKVLAVYQKECPFIHGQFNKGPVRIFKGLGPVIEN
jgi:hypothetical protein